MTIYEFLKVNSQVMSLMLKNGISPKDIEYLEIANQERELTERGEMKKNVTAELAANYNCSKRSVYNYVEKMRAELVL